MGSCEALEFPTPSPDPSHGAMRSCFSRDTALLPSLQAQGSSKAPLSSLQGLCRVSWLAASAGKDRLGLQCGLWKGAIFSHLSF